MKTLENTVFSRVFLWHALREPSQRNDMYQTVKLLRSIEHILNSQKVGRGVMMSTLVWMMTGSGLKYARLWFEIRQALVAN